MQCPSCQHTKTRILESRSTEAGQSIRRRRECLNCQHRFTTYERIEFVPIVVIKRSGRRESFDRSKVLRGLTRACEKTGIEIQQLETWVDDIEAQLHQEAGREVRSDRIGELVLQQLRQENEVAYVRFASVYRQFTGIEDFIQTLHQLHQSELNTSPTSDWYAEESPTCSTAIVSS
ncbi:MAG: transcriptional regulator NrdR [Jaaginema sp. PMC 1079.18]|nr:transcriptional regulator NrdR [Jaaginema sp. PMC 1080.18]MEC4849701.1 transcriptional regulator NrdR [Jaaginema sp. PMC 1079.18]MEC4864870.1 transcriptional regulator NrdR [Jaaginema sp. PMC 1078.18]